MTSFTGLAFLLLFLPCLLIFYYVPIKNIKYKNVILILFNLAFYILDEPLNIFLLLASILVNYLFVYLHYLSKKNIFTIIAIVLNVAILVFYKYSNQSLPLGISYYTFMMISYDVDIKDKPKLMDLLLYISFFATIISGPITKYSNFVDQIENREISKENLFIGIRRFAFGIIKKILIADNLSFLVDKCFYNIDELTTALAWIGAIAYTLQLYFDFSGFSDMTIGLARIFGFKLQENFNYPYIATSISDFWKRWHISLTKWFTNYIYIPLGGNRVSKLRNIFNIIVVWFVTGIWHGNGYTFLVWALINCVFQLLEKNTNLKNMPKGIGHIYTMLIVIISWCMFKSSSLSDAFNYIGIMFGRCNNGFINYEVVNVLKGYYLPLILGILFSLPIYEKYKESNLYRNNISNIMVQVAIYILLILAIASEMGFNFSASLYQGF